MSKFGGESEEMCNGEPCEIDIEGSYTFWKTEDFIDGIKVYHPIAKLDRCIVLGICFAFFCLFMHNRRRCESINTSSTWIRLESFCQVLIGLALYFFPTVIYPIMTTLQQDGGHEFLVQFTGAVMLSLGSVRLLSMSQCDNGVRASMTLSRAVGSSLMLMTIIANQLNYHVDNGHLLSERHLIYACLTCACWAIGSIQVTMYFANLKRCCKPKHQLKSELCKGVLLDVIANCAMAFWLYGFPKHAYYYIRVGGYKPDGIHLHLLKVLGVLLFTNCVYGISSMRFSQDEERRPYLYGQLIIYILLVPLLVLQSNVIYFKSMIFIYTVLALLLLNGLNAYYFRQMNSEFVSEVLKKPVEMLGAEVEPCPGVKVEKVHDKSKCKPKEKRSTIKK